MDGLALLCTLHADGPASLKRLRGIGCFDLEAFLARPTEELAHVLDVSPAQARRLRREASLLSERVAGGLLQEEEQSPERERGEQEVSEGEPGLTRLDRVILGRVLESWRERDRTEVLEQRPTPPLRPQDPPVAGSELARVPGLAPSELEALRELGVEAVEDLLESDPVELAAALDVPFSEARRMQFLARRARPAPAAPAPNARPGLDPPALPAAMRALEPVSTKTVASEPRPRLTPRRSGEQPFGAGIEGGGAPERDYDIPRLGLETSESLAGRDPDASGGPFA